MKKTVAAISVVAVILALFAGCRGNSGKNKEPPSQTPETSRASVFSICESP